MNDTVRRITREDASIDENYLKITSQREKESERKAKAEQRERKRRKKILKGIFRGTRNIGCARIINVYDKEGNYEATYCGSIRAAKALGVTYQTVNIQLKKNGIVAGKQVRVTEIAWIEGKPCVNKKSIKPATKRENPTPPTAVSVYDIDGDYLATYESIRQCAEKLKIDSGSICRMLKNTGRGEGTQQCQGYQFRRAKRMEEWSREKWDKRPIKPYTGRYRRKHIYKEYNTK